MKRSLILIVFGLFAVPIYGQKAEIAPAIELFSKSDYVGAIKLLHGTKDAAGLYYLGAALEKTGKLSDARSAFSRSFKTGYGVFEKAFAAWRAEANRKPFSAFIDGLGLLPTLLLSAEKAAELDASIMDETEWRVKANALFGIEKLRRAGEEIYRTPEVDRDPKILTRVRPDTSATNCVQRSNLDVKILVQLVLQSDGRTVIAIPLSPWTKICSDAVIIAAEKITFEPALKGGNPVSIVRNFEYTFSVR